MTAPRVERLQKLVEGRRALAAIAIAAAIFLALGVLVRDSFLQSFDLRVTKGMQEEHWPPLVTFMRGLTDIGSPAAVPIVAAVAALGLWQAKRSREAVLVLASLVSIPVFVVLKEFWHRARPDAAIVHVAVRTSGTSFPSGHATGGTALYGALAALAWIHLDRRHMRIPLALGLSLLPFGIDASRVYLGAHWLSDVIGGSAVGLLVLIPLLRWYLGGVTVKDAVEGAVGPSGQNPA